MFVLPSKIPLATVLAKDNKEEGHEVPGEDRFDLSQNTVKIQPGGIKINGESLNILMAGRLESSYNSKKKCHTIALEPSDQKRYVATVNDPVLGVITHKMMEFYRVDIGSAHTAVLPALAFENATKRNKPNLNVGSLVYARVVAASKDIETELACTSIQAKADGFGELQSGLPISISSRLSHQLIKGSSLIMSVLASLRKSWAFEMACGWNSKLWINAKTLRKTIVLAGIIQQSEMCSDEAEMTALVQTRIKEYYESGVADEEDAKEVASASANRSEKVDEDEEYGDDDPMIE